MNRILKPVVLSAGLFATMCLTEALQAPVKFGFVGDAAAIIGVAPGGSVARRHAVVATTAVTTTAVAATSANASAAAAANANAQAAAAKPPPPPAPAPVPGASPPIGSIVTALPPGCVQTDLNGVAYQRCGSTYYRASMMGSNLVFVVAQP